jgi:hypothetical protein
LIEAVGHENGSGVVQVLLGEGVSPLLNFVSDDNPGKAITLLDYAISCNNTDAINHIKKAQRETLV